METDHHLKSWKLREPSFTCSPVVRIRQTALEVKYISKAETHISALPVMCSSLVVVLTATELVSSPKMTTPYSLQTLPAAILS